MEQELIRELNEQIIKHFEDKEKDLQLKIDTFMEYINDVNIEDEVLDGLKDVVSDMKSVKTKLSRQIKRMKEKAEKGISLIKNDDKRYKNIFTDSKYEKIFDIVADKQEKVDNNIDRLEDLSSNISGESIVSSSIKKSLEKRISRLKTKKGRIQNSQIKIIDLATKEKINSYLKGMKKVDTISTLLLKTEKKSDEQQNKIDTLIGEKEKLEKMKEKLFSGNVLDKGIGVKVLFHEKLTGARIKALQAKKGVIDFSSKQLVIGSVNRGTIDKMKNKVADFGEKMSNIVKDTTNKIDEFFQLSPEPFKTR